MTESCFRPTSYRVDGKGNAVERIFVPDRVGEHIIAGRRHRVGLTIIKRATLPASAPELTRTPDILPPSTEPDPS